MSDINKWWINRRNTDFFVKKREEIGVVSRAYFKIEEIDKKFNIVARNANVLDLGCSPGGWIQYFKKKTSRILGIDLLPLKIPHNNFLQIDINDFNSDELFDLVTSDIAHNLSGDSTIDDGKMSLIIEMILKIVKKNLKKSGNFVIKVFDGQSCNEAIADLKLIFKIVKIFKPSCSRKESKEKYLVCLNKRN